MMLSQRGFTLLELLIALALIGLMVALLFGALRFGSKAWDASETRLQHNTSMSMVWRYLEARFSQARNLRRKLEKEEKPFFFFQGDSRAVEFVTPMPAHLGSGGLYITRIYKVGSGEKGKLMLTRWLYHPEVLKGESSLPRWRPLDGSPSSADDRPEQRAWYSSSTLVEGIESLEIDYYGRKDPKDKTADWSVDWRDAKLLPSLVRMRIIDEKGAWPEMIFQLPGA